MTTRPGSVAALLSAVVAFTALPSSSARACGGFACSATPIIQSRESVVYSYEADGTISMAVQINYEGRDEDFAWILPVPVVPDSIEVGVDALFTQLQAATEPTFVLDRRVDGTCAADPHCSYPGGGGFGCSYAAYESAPPYTDGGGVGADAGSVVIHSEGNVGPYDTVVIGAATASEVVTWLGDNSYDIPAGIEPLLEPYATQGFVFVALRLNANRDSSVIRPVVLSMATDEACLPIRLTPIASTPNLPIALYFLADRQAASTNYAYADVPLSLNLFRNPAGWDAAVASRVTELGGQAFATDFADATPSVSVELPEVTDLADEMAAGRLVSELRRRGYSSSPLLTEILTRFIDPPEGVDAASFISCLVGSSARCGTPARFDAVRLIAAVDREITQPRRRAQAMVDSHSYLTRLSTSMRSEDMTMDPVFGLDDGLEDVPRQRRGTLVTECSGDYFRSTAPTHLEVGSVSTPGSEGRIISGEQFCEDRGATLESGAGCASGRTGATPPVSLLFIMGFLAYRVTRRHRSKASKAR